MTLPSAVIELGLEVDPDRHPWFLVRINEPGPNSGEGVGFGPDDCAVGTAFEALGAAWAYTSPWYLDVEAPAAPAAGRAPLTEEDPVEEPTPTPVPSPSPTPAPTDPPSEEPGDPGAPAVYPVVTRRAGTGRVETAVALSSATFVEGTDTVVVADGGDFPDALTGVPVAAAVPAPVLLVATHSVPDPVVEEVQRLRPRRVVLLGGTAAVDEGVEGRFRDLVEVVERLAGDDRYATAAAISDVAFPEGAEEVWVVSGESFADALPGGPAVTRAGGPLLLTARDALPGATAAAVRRLAPRRIVVLGGAAVVGEEVVTELRTIAPTERIAGADRYQTAADVSRRMFPRAQAVVIASGEDFPDALAAGPVAVVDAGPVLLVRRDAIPAATDAELRRLKPEVITIAGGTAVISEEVQQALAAYDIRSDA